MTFEELLEHLRFEYCGALYATCRIDPPYGDILDPEKVERFPPFYDFLLTRGFNRFQLSARGVGRDIEA